MSGRVGTNILLTLLSQHVVEMQSNSQMSAWRSLSHLVLPPFLPVPAAFQVPIPQLKSQGLTRPAKPTAKKTKVAAGGTALLGLVTLLCLTGTIPSWPGSSNIPAHFDSHVSLLESTCHWCSSGVHWALGYSEMGALCFSPSLKTG